VKYQGRGVAVGGGVLPTVKLRDMGGRGVKISQIAVTHFMDQPSTYEIFPISDNSISLENFPGREECF